MVFLDQDLIIGTFCHTYFWWSICTTSLNSDDSIDCRGNLNFLGSLTCWHDRHAVTHFSPAFFLGSLTCWHDRHAVTHFSPAFFIQSASGPSGILCRFLMIHLIMRPEQKFCLIELRQHYRVIFVQDFVFFCSLAGHDPVLVRI